MFSFHKSKNSYHLYLQNSKRKNKKQADIEKYGLYTYDEFTDYISKEIFDLLPIPYLKISVGKGLTTKEKIIEVT